jgi:hypothetical protein
LVIGCDEAEERFEAALKVIAKYKPQAKSKVGKASKRAPASEAIPCSGHIADVKNGQA